MADLVAPLFPTYDFSPLVRGLAQMAHNRQVAQGIELAYQKQAQDAANDQQLLGIKRQQLANEFGVQQAQIRNYNALANYHNKMGNYYENYKANVQKDKDALLRRVSEYASRTSAIPLKDWGSDEGANQLGLLNQEYSDITQLPAGRQVMAANALRVQRAQGNAAAATKALYNQFKQSVTGQGITLGTMDALQTDDNGNFLKNEVWNVAPDGHPFVTIDGNTGTIVPPSQVGEYGSKLKPGWISTGFPTEKANTLLKMRDQIQGYQLHNPANAGAVGIGAPDTGATPSPTPEQAAPATSGEDLGIDPQAAVNWLQANPDDPNAAAVAARLQQMGVIQPDSSPPLAPQERFLPQVMAT